MKIVYIKTDCSNVLYLSHSLHTVNLFTVLLSAATITSPTATLIAGISSTTLTCEAAGNISSIQWIKDGLPLCPSNNITFSVDNRTVHLSPVQHIDNGEYDCLVSNPVSNQTASHNLTVNCEYCLLDPNSRSDCDCAWHLYVNYQLTGCCR